MVRIFYVMWFASWTIIFLLAATQIAIPLVRGRPLFPVLNKRKRVLERELAEAREKADADAARDELKDLRTRRQGGRPRPF